MLRSIAAFAPLAPRIVAFASLLGVLLASAPAHADVPPADGRKRVPFGFMVKGMGVAPDRVLFAYPCGTSDGAPIAEHRKLEEGVLVSVGRRGGNCLVYAITKSAYETWAASYKPTHASSDPALQALAAQSTACTGSPTIVTDIPSSDPRTAVTQVLNVTKLDAQTCVLSATGEAPAPTSTGGTAAPSSGGGSAPASAPGAKSGCAVSAARLATTTDAGALPSGWLASVAWFASGALLAARGRSRRRRRAA